MRGWAGPGGRFGVICLPDAMASLFQQFLPSAETKWNSGGWPMLVNALASAMRRVPRPSRILRRAGIPKGCSKWSSRVGNGSRHPIAKRNLSPTRSDLHRPSFVEPVETIGAPAPLLRRFHQPALHRIAMHVSQLFHALLRGPDIEVIETSLPDALD